MALWSPVYVDVSPELFAFRYGTNEVVLRPFLYMSSHLDRVVAINEEPPSDQVSHRIDLFSTPENSFLAKDRGSAMEAFLRYGQQKVTNRRRLIPRMIIRNIASLNPVLLGYQYYLFQKAFSGSKVVFE